MSEPSPYKDLRQDFFKNYFEQGRNFDDYLATGTDVQQNKWAGFRNSVKLSEHQHSTAASFNRKMNVLVLSGIWCGDCSRQGPMLQSIAEAAPNMDLRFIESKENPELQEELRINGATKVPVVVTLSEDFFEVGRFGDMHLSKYRIKLENELGAACDPGILPPPAEEIAKELSEWLDHFERQHTILRLAPMLRRRYED